MNRPVLGVVCAQALSSHNMFLELQTAMVGKAGRPLVLLCLVMSCLVADTAMPWWPHEAWSSLEPSHDEACHGMGWCGIAFVCCALARSVRAQDVSVHKMILELAMAMVIKAELGIAWHI